MQIVKFQSSQLWNHTTNSTMSLIRTQKLNCSTGQGR